MRTLKLLVEGETDKRLVEVLFQRLFHEVTIEIEPLGSKQKIRKYLANTTSNDLVNTAVLIDLDAFTVADASIEARRQMSEPSCLVFAAVPTVEAWLFADKVTAMAYCKTEHRRDIVNRLPSCEEIPYPNHVAKEVFPTKEDWPIIMANIDISVATARSSSLRSFLNGISEFFNISVDQVKESYARNISRDIFVNLLSEVTPSDTVLYRTMDGYQYTSEQMIELIRSGDHIGVEYATDVLRLARNLLAKQARREAGK